MNYELEVLTGVIIGVLVIMIVIFLFYPSVLQHLINSTTKRKNVYNARAGNLQNAAQCYGKSCDSVNNNARFYRSYY